MKHKWYNEIVAYAEGRTIQCRACSNGPWYDDARPLFWNDNVEFRIKPEPKPDAVTRECVRFERSRSAWINCIWDGESGELKSVEIVK